MFTGLIEEIGTVERIQSHGTSKQLVIHCDTVLDAVSMGDSIATNGVCLTVSDFTKDSFTADVMVETVTKTNLAGIKIGDKVNLERALRVGDRLGGHFVSGHIDGTGKIRSVRRLEHDILIEISCPDDLLSFIVEKGSIAIDGISLTVANLGRDYFTVSIIPTTSSDTTLTSRNVGDVVNLECDMIGKYIYKFTNRDTHGVTLDLLKENGFI